MTHLAVSVSLLKTLENIITLHINVFGNLLSYANNVFVHTTPIIQTKLEIMKITTETTAITTKKHQHIHQ